MTQRQDARRNRARIIAAAGEVFRESGAGAPLDLVAVRAGVGRATLYRHFPDRGSLMAAFLEARVDALEQLAADDPSDDLLERLLVEICALQQDMPGLMAVVRSSHTPANRLEAVVDRTWALLAAALETALRARVVRADLTLDDVVLAVAMLDGVVNALAHRPGTASVERALTLLLRSLRVEGRADLPTPARALLAAPVS